MKDISTLHSSGRPIIYTDGAYWNSSARSSCSFTCFHQGTWSDFFYWCPSGSSFDSEIAAIEQAVHDNKAALSSFLDTRVRPSHMATIRINGMLMDRMSSSPTHMTFCYCPSHSGLEGNDRADQLTKRGATIAPITPPRILLSNFVHDYNKCLTTQWRMLAASQSFRGRQWLPIRRRKKPFKLAIRNKATTNFFYNLSGNDIATLSRMAHALTNHAPTGDY